MRFYEVTDDSDEVLVDTLRPYSTLVYGQAGWSNIWKSLVTASASLRETRSVGQKKYAERP